MFYVKGDAYQLADDFEHCIDVFMNLFNLDPSYDISVPRYFQDAILKVTGEEIPLLTDPDMHLLFEDGKRGGVAMAMNRRMVANNEYMKSYDPGKLSNFIQYWDTNSLYTSILAGPLPFKDFRWVPREYLDEVKADYSQIKPGHYRVDLVYPKELHDVHNAFPLAIGSLTLDGVTKLASSKFV